MTNFHDRRCGATAAAGADTATHRPLSTHQDAPRICICDPELLAMDVFDIRCPAHGLTATLTAIVAEMREADRG